MDALTKAVIFTFIITVGVFGAIVFMTLNDVNQANIPDVERGTVLSKQVLSQNSTGYSITLSDGKVLYILNDASLFESIKENQTYVFNCRVDFNRKMILIDDASLASDNK